MKNKKGSALLVVICTMGMMLFIIATIWRSSVFVYELGLARQKYEQNYWQTSALMTWAIALCKENFDHFLNYTEHNQQEIAIKKWPPINTEIQDQKFFNALITLSKKAIDQIEIMAKLGRGNKNQWALSCILKREKQDDGKSIFIIQNWDIK